jgi:hypothetical protein
MTSISTAHDIHDMANGVIPAFGSTEARRARAFATASASIDRNQLFIVVHEKRPLDEASCFGEIKRPHPARRWKQKNIRLVNTISGDFS